MTLLRRPDRVAVLADTDSRWKWGTLTARQLSPVNGIDPYLLDLGSRPSARQLRAAGIDPADVVPVGMPGLVEALLVSPPEVLVVAEGGGGVIAAISALAAGWPPGIRRPIVVSGYFGVVYEKLVEGLLGRVGSDIVLANSPHDAERFASVYAGLGLDPSVVVETRLPFLRDSPPRAAQPPFTVVFACQPSVPAGYGERDYVIRRLIRHAELHPERRVVLKLRAALGERVTHAEPYPYPAILRRHHVPANFEVSLGDMGETLREADLLLTVSSTAALEAMHAGLPTALLTDFGVREGLGNAYFVGSGCLASFDEVDAGLAPVPDPEWSWTHGVDGAEPEAFVERVSTLLGSEPAPLRPYYTAGRSPSYLPRLLASYGLAADGRALPSPPGRAGRLMRRGIRRTARTLYHGGVTTVAPVLTEVGVTVNDSLQPDARPEVVAVIPARGGSKGVPGKNLALVGGVPLVVRAVRACLAATRPSAVVVTTDDDGIADAARKAGAVVVTRPPDLSGDTAGSEEAVTHALEVIYGSAISRVDVVVLVQCTSPFTTPGEIDDVVQAVLEGADTAFTAARFHGFVWRPEPDGAVAVNHHHKRRARRQERPVELLETGAAYAMRGAGFLAKRRRFFGTIRAVETAAERVLEIDDFGDLQRARVLAPTLDTPTDLPGRNDVDAVVLDFDGTQTDDRVWVMADGSELVAAHRGDGMGIAALRRAGIELLILSAETNPVVSARAAKLGVECRQGIAGKGRELTAWCAEKGLDPARVLYLGNDVNDLPGFAEVGWPVAVASAHPPVRAAARAVTTLPGGHGAVREIASWILGKDLS